MGLNLEGKKKIVAVLNLLMISQPSFWYISTLQLSHRY